MSHWNIRLLTTITGALMAAACGGHDSPLSPTSTPIVNPKLTAPTPDTPSDQADNDFGS